MHNKVLYVDDSHDLYLSQYLVDLAEEMKDTFAFTHEDYTFYPGTKYSDIVKEIYERQANVIIIDSKLFENSKAESRFKGEEVMLVLKKIFPYIEVLVITQNKDSDFDSLEKYKSVTNRHGDQDLASREHYDRELLPHLKASFKKLQDYERLVEQIRDNNTFDKVLRDSILSMINGTENYVGLTEEDINDLVKKFQDVKSLIDERL